MIATGGSMANDPESRVHVPVLLGEVLGGLRGEAEPETLTGWIVDGTVGAGGHARALLERFPRVRLFGVDQDPEVLAHARAQLSDFGERVQLCLARVSQLYPRLLAAGAFPVVGFLLDLGANSLHFDRPARGFSLQADGPLDMRMDPTCGAPVSDWLAHAGLDEIRQVIATLGEERFARRVAEAIVAERRERPITRTSQLAALAARAVRTREPGKHPATRTFQALRMFVNDELGQLERGLAAAFEVLAPGGRLAVISFHSLEDRIVKQFMQSRSRVDPALADLPVVPEQARPKLRIAGSKRRPGEAELAANPRSRSAMLRVAEKLD